MNSRIRYDDENNIFVESKEQKFVRRYKEYYDKIKSIKDVVNGELENAFTIPEGTKVKLNYERITTEPDYKRKVKGFREFVENNKDTIFTVEYDKKYKEKPIMVSFKEDKREVKWLWHCESDLIIVENDN